jgi:3-oxoadipate enol-lactonase
MPTIRVGDDLDMHYLVDDYTDPWGDPETVLLLHGSSESSAMWFGWVPQLARHFRVVRPDMRGFGASSPMPRDYPWPLDRIIDDFVALTNHLGIKRFHLVGAKIAATIARASWHAFRSRRTTLVGAPPPRRDHADGTVAKWHALAEREGVEGWARSTMSGRLGSGFPAAGQEWWVKLMGRTPLSTWFGFVATIPTWDVAADLPRIQCPTLVITTGVARWARWRACGPGSRRFRTRGCSPCLATRFTSRRRIRNGARGRRVTSYCARQAARSLWSDAPARRASMSRRPSLRLSIAVSIPILAFQAQKTRSASNEAGRQETRRLMTNLSSRADEETERLHGRPVPRRRVGSIG